MDDVDHGGEGRSGDRLARFLIEQEPGDYLSPASALEGLHLALRAESGAAAQSQRSLGLPTAAEVELGDITAGMRELPAARRDLEVMEVALIEAGMDRGVTWDRLAAEAEVTSGEALRRRYSRIGGTRSWPPGRRAGRDSDSAPDSAVP